MTFLHMCIVFALLRMLMCLKKSYCLKVIPFHHYLQFCLGVIHFRTMKKAAVKESSLPKTGFFAVK